jgi:hypothetical protein
LKRGRLEVFNEPSKKEEDLIRNSPLRGLFVLLEDAPCEDLDYRFISQGPVLDEGLVSTFGTRTSPLALEGSGVLTRKVLAEEDRPL